MLKRLIKLFKKEYFVCPRTVEGPFRYNDKKSYWRKDGTCSYCGSINTKTLFDLIKNGTYIEPTDKNYKIYINTKGSVKSKIVSWTNAKDRPDKKWKRKYIFFGAWVVREKEVIKRSKFYFQHFSEGDKETFVDMLNNKQIKFEYPGYFYVLPFFIGKD